jgi:hypothetical protein
MDPTTWTKDSDKFGHKRSTELKAIDTALAAYTGAPGKQTLYTLVDAFLDWYEARPNWLASMRKKDMIDLVNYIKQRAAIHVPNVDGYVFNRRMARRKLNQMLAAPEDFLNKYRISIAGDPGGNNAGIDFRVTVDCGDLLFDNAQLGASPIFFPIAGYKFSSIGSVYGPKVNAVSIVMHKKFPLNATAADVQARLYPVNAGALMMTGTLTACSFVIQSTGGLPAPIFSRGLRQQDQGRRCKPTSRASAWPA